MVIVNKQNNIQLINNFLNQSIMKKSLFAILAIATCFASCSKVVETTVFDEPISFDGYIGKDAVTKASIIEKTDVTEVKVNAYLHYATETEASGDFKSNFMLEQAVTLEGGAWDYKPLKYWPATDRSIDFVSWVDVDNITVEGDLLTLTVPEAATEQVDLLVSNPVLDKNGAREAKENTDRNVVALKFKHLLSRIRFEIEGKSLPSDGVNVVTLTELSLNGSFASEGTVDMRAKAPMVEANEEKEFTEQYIIEGSDLGLAGNDKNVLEGSAIYNTANQDAYLMLIPDKAAPDFITLTYTVTTYEVDEDGKPTATPSGDPVVNTAKFKVPQEYEAGKAYAYKFTIEMDAISFTVDVEDWAEEVEDEIENNYDNQNNA